VRAKENKLCEEAGTKTSLALFNSVQSQCTVKMS